jgi:ribulose-5-phosphate 4-epimerase/fuculose-1-phosphate aldolase
MAAITQSRGINRTVRAQVSDKEWAAREDLAALYRFIAAQKWDDHIFTHLSMRVPGETDNYLLNPLNLTFNEITASSLLKITSKGEKAIESEYLLNRAAYIIHHAVYDAIPHANCVIHLHTPHGTAVSMQADGLLPYSQHAMMLGKIAYHDYEGLATHEEECERLARDMGESKCMILRNHGTLTWGQSVAEAFGLMFNFERACEYQVLAMAGGAKLYQPDDKAIRDTATMQYKRKNPEDSPYNKAAWDAVRRNLDRVDPSYRD